MKRFLSIVTFIFLCLSVSAQDSDKATGSLAGVIIDAKTGETLIGVTVLIDGTQIGSVTDLNGNYLINDIVPNSYTVTASYIGYESITRYNIVIRSGGNPDLNFELAESTTELEGVVVTANPFEKLEETPLSIQKLSAEEVAT